MKFWNTSPIPLFYSDLTDKNYELSFYNKNMLKYSMEQGIYLLTVNFREDPLGFPTNNNLTISQMEEIMGVKIENPQGLIYDNSKIWSKRSAFFAHTSYWSARGCFANAVVKTFVNGTKFLYDEKYVAWLFLAPALLGTLIFILKFPLFR